MHSTNLAGNNNPVYISDRVSTQTWSNLPPMHSLRNMQTTNSMLILITSVVLVLILGLVTAGAAEDEFTLFIAGDRVDVIDNLPDDITAAELLSRYYAELPAEQRQRLQSLKRDLEDLMPDYDVAFSAADTAEVNAILSEVTRYWSSILSIHAETFTPQAAQQLRKAYGELYPLLAVEEKL